MTAQQGKIVVAGQVPDGIVDYIVDKETGYKCRIYEQRTFIPGLRVFLALYARKGKWVVASPQLTDRVLRRAGLPMLTDVPWGPGPELAFSVDDVLDAQAEASKAAPNLALTVLKED